MKNCTQYLISNSNASLTLKSKYSWTFNLTTTDQVNTFEIEIQPLGSVGEMLLYSFDHGEAAGRIGLTSEASVSDLFITPENYTQQLNSSLGFSVYLVLGSLKKTFTVWSKPMYYGYPGDYYIKIWLQNNGPFDYSTAAPVKVTDSKCLISLLFLMKLKKQFNFFPKIQK